MKIRPTGLKLALGVFVFASLAGNLHARERIVNICIGEDAEKCQGKGNHAPCGIDVEKHAKGVCTIRDGNGSRVVPHFIDLVSTVSGNRCGYSVYKITCELDPVEGK